MAIASVSEIICGSPKSFKDAIDSISAPTRRLKMLKALWVKDQSIIMDNGKTGEYRVILKVTFVLSDTK
ncbi:MAG: dodecin family protein [Parvularculaceae bacterium]